MIAYMNSEKPLIGFIGQGFIGNSYATDFESRGFEVVRYALEEPYIQNKDRIKDCDIVFIAVPTPTRPSRQTGQASFDISIVEGTLPLIKDGASVVIKSTLFPGTIKKLFEKYPQLFLMHSPEFLREKTALQDAANPERNIIGIPQDTDEFKKRAQEILDLLPPAPYTLICSSTEAEMIKYGGNCFLFTKVIFMNLMYDLAKSQSANFDVIKDAMMQDSRIGNSHMNPIHASGHVDDSQAARGAGGHCFIKDFSAFIESYEPTGDTTGLEVLRALEKKNIELLKNSNKDLDLLEEVYGK